MFSDTLAGAPSFEAPGAAPHPLPDPPKRGTRRWLAVVAVLAVAGIALSGVLLSGSDPQITSGSADPSAAPTPNGACRSELEGNRTQLHDPVLVCTKTGGGFRWLTTGEALETAAEGRSIRGTFTLIDADVTQFGSGGCSGTGGYSDISSTTQVVVKNGRGDILGVTELGLGSIDTVSCTYHWVVDELPKEGFYVVEVGRRGSLTFSAEELESRDWRVFSSLG